MKILRKIISLVFSIIVIIAGIFSFYRWFAFDDAADIQGNWKIGSSQKVVPITSDKITLTDDATYSYSLDKTAKKITVKLGDMSGNSHYSFSFDRKQLVIVDKDLNALEAVFTDVSDLFSSVTDGSFSLSKGGFDHGNEDGIIRLNKVEN